MPGKKEGKHGGQQNQTHQNECGGVYRCDYGPKPPGGRQGPRQIVAESGRRKAKDVDHYTYDSGREGDMPVVAFSPRKAATVLYGLSAAEALLPKLGKHTRGKGCVYIKKLADVDQKVLEAMVVKSVAGRAK